MLWNAEFSDKDPDVGMMPLFAFTLITPADRDDSICFSALVAAASMQEDCPLSKIAVSVTCTRWKRLEAVCFSGVLQGQNWDLWMKIIHLKDYQGSSAA